MPRLKKMTRLCQEYRLSPRHKQFVEAYFENGFNASQAGKTAGYPSRFYAHTLLKSPRIKRVIRAMMADAGVNPERILSEYKELAFNGESEQTRLAALDKLAKLCMAMVDKPQAPSVNVLAVGDNAVADLLSSIGSKALLPVGATEPQDILDVEAEVPEEAEDQAARLSG